MGSISKGCRSKPEENLNGQSWNNLNIKINNNTNRSVENTNRSVEKTGNREFILIQLNKYLNLKFDKEQNIYSFNISSHKSNTKGKIVTSKGRSLVDTTLIK